jgi:integrase
LGVRVTPNGAKAFVFQGKLDGATVRMTLGDASTWTLDAARREARRLRMLIDQGVDPRLEREERRAEVERRREELRRAEITTREAWERYIEERRHHWSARHLADHLNAADPGGAPRKRGDGVTAPGPLAALMELRLRDLTAERIVEWLKAESARRPTQAAIAYRLLRAFLRRVQEKGGYAELVAPGAVQARAVRDHVPRVKAKVGDCLQREHLRPWFEAVKTLTPEIGAYLQTLLLLGARPTEVRELRWSDVDFLWSTVTLRDKVEEERVAPLPRYVAHLLSTLPRRSEYVFSSPRRAGQPINPPNHQMTRACQLAGIPPVTLHGLRRSFGTLSEWVEAPTGVVAQIMGHKPSAIAEKHYRRRPIDLLRQWHERIVEWILAEAAVELPAVSAFGETAIAQNAAEMV